MNPDVRELLEEAHDSVAAAKTLLAGGYPGYAAARAYYAMFYVAEAFLETEGMAFSKHSAVHAAFGRYFAHPGRVPEELHRHLLDAFDTRLDGDYGPRHAVSPEKAAEQIRRAERFIQVAQEHFGRMPPREHDLPQGT